MNKQIELNNKLIEYTLRVSNKARRVRLAIYRDGKFVVTRPARVSEHRIEQFIIQKSAWIIKKLQYFKSISGVEVRIGNKKEFRELKATANRLAKEKIQHFNKFYGFKFGRVVIRNQKTRWGSCSKKGNLNFNYRIALLPEKLVDYIVVHELCHLKELNHSKNFWNLVAKTIPNYLELRKELKKSGVQFK